jgi:transposase
MIPYPKELRTRVVAAVERGENTIAEVADFFSVSVAFVKKMLKLHRAGDDLEPRHGGGTEVLLKEKELALLREEVEKRCVSRLRHAIPVLTRWIF